MNASISTFKHFSFAEKRLLYQGLVSLVKSNSGSGFCNCDQGHMAYVAGRTGKVGYDAYGDSPEHNMLYKMMLDLSTDLIEAELEGKSEIAEYIISWTDFCNMAYDAYVRNKTNVQPQR